MVSVPTESRSASSISSADRAEIGEESQLAYHENSRPQHRKRRERSSAFTESQTKIKDRFQAQLVERELLGWFR